jgi:hypothetical protein
VGTVDLGPPERSEKAAYELASIMLWERLACDCRGDARRRERPWSSSYGKH